MANPPDMQTITVVLPTSKAQQFRAFCQLRGEPMSTVLGKEIERLLRDTNFSALAAALVQQAAPSMPLEGGANHPTFGPGLLKVGDCFFCERKKVPVVITRVENGRFYLRETLTGLDRRRGVNFATLAKDYSPRNEG